MDRIGKKARAVGESVGGEKFFVLSFTDSVLENVLNGNVLALRNAELTFATLSGFNSGQDW